MKILQKTCWKAFNEALKIGPKKTIEKIKEKGLSGRSGATFPTGIKLELGMKAQSDDKYFICNAHEGEPGTFKDRFLLENVPENIIEGVSIASFAIGARKAYIYFKHGYPELFKGLNKIIKDSKGYLDKIDLEITVLTGAGAYICGEATAIIDSIEGIRGEPRKTPPFPTDKGLYGKPTVVDNVETIANIPQLFIDQEWDDESRLYSISGDVENPGVYESRAGSDLNELLKRAKLKGKIKAIFLGATGGCIKPEAKLREKDLRCKGAGIGCRSIIVVNESRDIIDITKNLAEFFVHESCGKCTPCREGTFRVLEIVDKISDKRAEKKDLETLKELAEFIQKTSFCGLGKTSTRHILTSLNNFRKEFESRCK